MIAPYFSEYMLIRKYICMQLVLVFAKLQPAFVGVIMNFIRFPCQSLIPPASYKSGLFKNLLTYTLLIYILIIEELCQLIFIFCLITVTINTIIIFEMQILLIIALKAYKVPSKAKR